MLLCLLTASSVSHAGGRIEIPDLHIYDYGEPCSQLFAKLRGERISGDSKEVRKVIEFGNLQFERRDWPAEFLDERFQIAEKYKSRSEYSYVKSLRSSKIWGTLGLTYARYSRSQSSTSLEILPMEDSLGVHPVGRPLDRKGNGIIFEFRTYAIDKVLNRSVFTLLVRETLPVLFEKLKSYPDLYDQPVIYTYVDKVSMRLYGAIGFELTADTPRDKPIVHDGVEWWVMAATPKTLESRVFNTVGDRTIMNLNQPHPVKLKTGITVMAAPRTSLTIYGDESPRDLIFNSTEEVAPGIYAAKGTQGYWAKPGLTYPTEIALARSAPFDRFGTTIPRRSTVELGSDGKILMVHSFGQATFVKKLKLWVGKDASLWTSKSNEIWGSHERPIEEIGASNLLRNTEIAPRLWAAAGAQVGWIRRNPDGPFEVSYVETLSKSYRFSNGKIAKVGWSLDFRRNGVYGDYEALHGPKLFLGPNPHLALPEN